jgi:hypothetical protein
MRNVNYNITVLNIQLILLAQLSLFFYSTWVKKLAQRELNSSVKVMYATL